MLDLGSGGGIDVLLSAGRVGPISIESTRRYRVADAGIGTSTLPAGWEEADGKIASAFVRATKPAGPQTREC